MRTKPLREQNASMNASMPGVDAGVDGRLDIRRARPSDALPLCRLRRKTWQAAYADPKKNITLEKLEQVYRFTSPEILQVYRAMLAQDDHIFMLVTRANSTDPGNNPGNNPGEPFLAYGSVIPRLNELATLYVDPEAQRQSIGSRLLHELLQRLDPHRAVSLHVVDDNYKAQNFYRAHRFEIVGPSHLNFELRRLPIAFRLVTMQTSVPWQSHPLPPRPDKLSGNGWTGLS